MLEGVWHLVQPEMRNETPEGSIIELLFHPHQFTLPAFTLPGAGTSPRHAEDIQISSHEAGGHTYFTEALKQTVLQCALIARVLACLPL